MNPYLTTLGLVAGICFAFGILNLFIGLRRKHDRKLTLTFAFFALSYAAAVLAGMGNYSATSVTEWLSSAGGMGCLSFPPGCYSSGTLPSILG